METTKKAPASFREKLKFMGPGVVLAALAIGPGELILTPRSGAQYGFALLWVPILTIVYKAAFSEGLARLTIASGDDVFRAFDWLPGHTQEQTSVCSKEPCTREMFRYRLFGDIQLALVNKPILVFLQRLYKSFRANKRKP